MADAGVELMDVSEDYIVGKVLASDVVDPETGDVLLKCTDELSADGMELLREKNITEVRFIQLDEEGTNSYIRNTMLIDKIETEEDGIVDVYRRLRPSNPPRLKPPAGFSTASSSIATAMTCLM